jgi:hypothetical protein
VERADALNLAEEEPRGTDGLSMPMGKAVLFDSFDAARHWLGAEPHQPR